MKMPRTGRTRKSNPAPPVVEKLQERTLMTAALPLDVSEVAMPGGTQLRITGTQGNDLITVRQTPTGLIIGNTGGWTKAITHAIQSLWIHGGAGNNSINLDASVTLDATIFGGGVNDNIVGGSGNNTIYGGTGKNVLTGRAGNDTLVTIGSTTDTLIGGAGRDSFWTDSSAAQKIMDASKEETATGAIHRVANFYNASAITTQKVTPGAKTVSASVRVKEPGVDAALAYSALSNSPIFSSAGPSVDDIFQGNATDCYFLSVLSSTAKVDPTRIRESFLDMNDGTVVVQLFKSGKPVYVREDALLPTTGGVLNYAGLGTQNSSWVALMEKAFCYVRSNKASYASIDLGWMDEAYRALGCNPTSTYSVASASALMNVINKALTAGQSVTCATNNSPPSGSGLVAGHAYTVDKVNLDSKGTVTSVTLRNPWGCGVDGTGNGYITVSAAIAFKALAGTVTANV